MQLAELEARAAEAEAAATSASEAVAVAVAVGPAHAPAPAEDCGGSWGDDDEAVARLQGQLQLRRLQVV